MQLTFLHAVWETLLAVYFIWNTLLTRRTLRMPPLEWAGGEPESVVQ